MPLKHWQTHYQILRDNNYRVGCVGKLDLAKPDSYNGRFGDRPAAYSFGFTHPEECEEKMHAAGSLEPLGPYAYYLKEKGLLKKFHKETMYQRKHSYNDYIDSNTYESVLDTEDFEDVYIGRRSAKWLKEILDDFPWFFLASFVGPHDPFDSPAEFIENYKDKKIPEPIKDDLEGKPDWIKQRVKNYDCNNEEDIKRVKKLAVIMPDILN